MTVKKKVLAFCMFASAFAEAAALNEIYVDFAVKAEVPPVLDGKLDDPAWKDAAPGTILKIEKTGPVVRCHDTALQLVEVKPEGSSQMDGGSFCRGRQMVAGETRFVME